MKYYCDTNFILRYLIADNKEQFEETKKIFQQTKIGEISLFIEQTVFTEVIFVLSSFYKVPRGKISEILSELLIYKGIICEDKESLLLALDVYSKHNNLHIVDSILASKSRMYSCPLLAFDQELISTANTLISDPGTKI
jgi:predicted nucleic-acid-binding protein